MERWTREKTIKHALLFVCLNCANREVAKRAGRLFKKLEKEDVDGQPKTHRGSKKLHKPHHRIPTVAWKHWGKKAESKAILCSIDDIKTEGFACHTQTPAAIKSTAPAKKRRIT